MACAFRVSTNTDPALPRRVAPLAVVAIGGFGRV